MLGVALGCALAFPALACAQDVTGALRPDEMMLETPQLDNDSRDSDPAAAGDVALTEDDVQSLQETLKDLGYFFGPADGRKGPRTRTALRNFQRDQGIAVSGSFDDATMRRLNDQAKIARTEHRPPTVSKSDESTAMPAEPQMRPRRSGNPIVKVGQTVADGTMAGINGIGTAGRATGAATATAGKATAKAGVATYEAGETAGKAVGTATVFVYNTSRRAIIGDGRSRGDRSDDTIKKSIERQYADEDRIVPSEVDVRVSHGNVTLALPEGARTDIAHAVRLAKLTPGVQSVTTVTTSVQETADSAQP